MTHPSTVADTLDAAADLLSKPGAWTQEAYARGKSGREVESRKAAVCFCLLGAVSYVKGSAPAEENVTLTEARAIRQAIGIGEYGSISEWNDRPECTQSDAVAALQKAATLARGEVQP